MFGMNDLMDSDELHRSLHDAMIQHTDDLRYIFRWFPFVSEEDFISKMVDSFIEEYTAYADQERILEEHGIFERAEIYRQADARYDGRLGACYRAFARFSIQVCTVACDIQIARMYLARCCEDVRLTCAEEGIEARSRQRTVLRNGDDSRRELEQPVCSLSRKPGVRVDWEALRTV